MRCGIDLGGTKIAALLLAANGEQLYTEQLPTPKGDYEATLSAIVALARQADRIAGTTCPVGLAAPGSESPLGDYLRNSNSTCLNGQRLRADLAERLAREVRIENDANCFVLSEATDGAAADFACVFGVILGTGMGAGIVVDRRLIRGANRIAGEWGHNRFPNAHVKASTRQCYCGRDDCNETWLSGPGLERSYLEACGGSGSVPVQTIVARAQAGEQLALDVLQQYYQDLAAALAVVVNILDPDAIVLGGGVGQIPQLAEELQRCLPAEVFSDTVTTAIVQPRYGAASGVRGAARLFPVP